MQPDHSETSAHKQEAVSNCRRQWSVDMPTLSRSASIARRLRSEDSWIDISSQPSSSSLSSAGDHEIVTTGLQIRQSVDAHRKRGRRAHTTPSTGRRHHGPSSAAGSSQDEYEESESESDKILSSSNEELDPEETVPRMIATLERAAEDGDDSLTAIGTGNSENNVFTPQPNAFSHPPSSQGNQPAIDSIATPDSYFPLLPDRSSAPSSARLSSNSTMTPRQVHSSRPRPSQVQSSQRAPSHSPYNTMAPSHEYHPDHDAALRASLSTLLSCAAAVRASPKGYGPSTQPAATRTMEDPGHPTSFRLLPGSQLTDNGGDSTRPTTTTRYSRSPILESAASRPSSPKHAATAKRKAREQSKDRHAKKSRSAVRSGSSSDEATISPTLMSWMVSAGVVLVFSAISFSAGYAWGKEVGRLEGATGTGIEGVSCGREVMRSGTGLRRLRWTTGPSGVTA